MSMQMDAYLKKEQVGSLFVRVGAPEGGFRRGGGANPKIIHAYTKNMYGASCTGSENFNPNITQGLKWYQG